MSERTSSSGRTALRVLAHPLRSRLLAELRVHGAATATELAAALETNTGATSYHLRQLAEVGLIEDTAEGTGRRRVWRAVATGTPEASAGILDADPDDPDDLAAADWLARDYLEHFTDRAGAWLGSRADWPTPWQSVLGLEDHLVLVSAEQMTALREELVEVLERYRRLGQGNPQAKRVSVYTCALPVDPTP
ncbi:helix-turn-helix domain-containing protein [Ornithinimicrobium sp. F0845]|uniref:winged helix-turn-helix domain-containing protein n=1 Tax=Ornithinimicrobium sp. F0845 TaxID=2926412 RepID=UPI001FF3AB4A|nr:helix-turn-helix domain-containing protein [Ornithinimicrobium sp. F0845]MCK0110994.1 helix-turn-helix domain-containing protein [Ornithinimicrobium sp. F0845]